MKCHKLRDNKKCDRKHEKEDLTMARELIRAKGQTPCFNAFDCSETFKQITTAFMEDNCAKAVIDTGAKKTVCGSEWLRLYQNNLERENKKLPRKPREVHKELKT